MNRTASRWLFLGCLLWALFLFTGYADTDSRKWQLMDGSHFTGSQSSYDEDLGKVTFQVAVDETKVVLFEDLSPIDRAWLISWIEIEEEMETLMKELGGKFEHHVAKGKTFTTDYYVYYPSHYKSNDQCPLLLLFNAGGAAAPYVKKFAKVAENAGLIVVGCGTFRNTGDDPRKEAEMLARFRELLPMIESKINHDPDRLFMGGNSGGAWRSYAYSAFVDRPWAGIYANGGWLGGKKNYDRPYPSDMRIAMVNGNEDHANRWIDSDSEILISRGNIVALFSFEGGHIRAPDRTRAKALEWLLETEETSDSD